METLSGSYQSPRVAFADTSALFALAVVHDQHHSQARRISAELVAARTQLLTSNFIVAEFHALIVNRVHSASANEALSRLENSEIQIVRILVRDEQHARSILDRYPGHGYTLTDATSFSVMERLGISIAFTFDHHIALQGYTIPT